MNYSLVNLRVFQNALNYLAFDIKTITDERIEQFTILLLLIDSSNKLKCGKELVSLGKKRLLGKDVSLEFTRILNDWSVGLEENVNLYKNNKDEFEKEYWKNFYPLISEIKERAATTVKKM